MSHQPYETFLFSSEALDKDQQGQLEIHLRECEQCSALSFTLASVDEAFSCSETPLPAPGFTRRWQAHLTEYRQKRQVRNLWLMTLGSFSLTSLIVMIIALLNLIQINWAYQLSQSIARISLFTAQVRQCFTLFNSLSNTLPITIPVIIFLGIGAVLSIFSLSIIWFGSIIKLYSPIRERGH